MDGTPAATLANWLLERDGATETRVAARRGSTNRDRLLVHEGERVSTADGGAAVLREIPGESDRRAEVVQILVVEVAVDERDLRGRVEHHLVEGSAVGDRQETQVIVLVERAVVLPLQSPANGEVRFPAPVVLHVGGDVVERVVLVRRDARHEARTLVLHLERLRHRRDGAAQPGRHRVGVGEIGRGDSAGELCRLQLDTARRNGAVPEVHLRERASVVVRVDVDPLPAAAHLQLVAAEHQRCRVIDLIRVRIAALRLEADGRAIAADWVDDAERGRVLVAAVQPSRCRTGRGRG